MPPRRKATNLAPFLTNTPAHIPHTLPKVNSYRFRADAGSGGMSEPSWAGVGVTAAWDACRGTDSEDMSTYATG